MSREPDLQNRMLGVRVWILRNPTEAAYEQNPDWRAGLQAWVVEADPGVLSPVITHWYGGVVTLRDVPGVPLSHRQFPDAEYEIMSMSIDPSIEVDWVDLYDARAAGEQREIHPGHLLSPADIVFQWKGTTDEQARDLAGAFLRAVLSGNSPDRPVHPFAAFAFDHNWKRVLEETVKHYVSGHWPDVPEARA